MKGLQSCFRFKKNRNIIYVFKYQKFSVQQKEYKEQTINTLNDSIDKNILTPRQKIREWTKAYHQMSSSKWVKNHFGIPFWALHIKYIQWRYLQRIWATRILRREGLGDIWNIKSLLYPTQVKIEEDDENELFFCDRPPIPMQQEGGKEEEEEKVIIDSLQYWYDTYSIRNYWKAFDHQNGNIIFSHVKWQEHIFRKHSKQNAIRCENTNILKPKNNNKKINPYTIIPEENPNSENIQYGGRYLSDYIDFKLPKTNKNKYIKPTASSNNNMLATFKGIVSNESLETNIRNIESIKFDEHTHTSASASDINKIIGARELIDERSDIYKNSKFSGLQQLIQLFPSFKEMSIILLLKKYSFIGSIKLVLNDYKNYKPLTAPPQISLCEFNYFDQFEISIGNYGPQHTLFSDWFIAIDNKRELSDKSYGIGKIINDRLIFEGFLIHSCIEMGHRTNNRFRDFVGFVNLVSHEFEPEWDLLPYYSIGIKLRSDGRTYLLGLECLNRNKLMIFNGIISIPPTPDNEWDYLEICLHHFRPYDNGQFIQGENWMKVRYLRSIGIQAMGRTGSFKLEIAWIRAMSFNARYDIENENINFIQDIDALGIYREDLMKFHIIQHQYFIDDFPDPFRFEDNGVFDDNVYLGSPRTQREHFSKLSPDLLRYIDIIDNIPIPITNDNDIQRYLLYYLDNDDMYMFENYLTNKLIGNTKHIQQLFKNDTISISDATNNLLYNQLKNQSKHNKYLTSNIYQSKDNSNSSNNKIPFSFKDITQTSNNPITILTNRRRELLRQSIPPHLRERVVGKTPHLV